MDLNNEDKMGSVIYYQEAKEGRLKT
jgi:hypothetical protein